MATRTPRHVEQRWLSRAEAAEYLGVSLASLDYLIARGELPAYKMPTRTGNNRRQAIKIDRGDIDAMLTATPVRSAGAS
jgi:excisionase family DNA binding protein